jgi:hypothetical protein
MAFEVTAFLFSVSLYATTRENNASFCSVFQNFVMLFFVLNNWKDMCYFSCKNSSDIRVKCLNYFFSLSLGLVLNLALYPWKTAFAKAPPPNKLEHRYRFKNN